MFKTYKNRPKSVEAVQFTNENKDQVLNSLTGQHAPDFENDIPVIKITTIHGETAIVRFGDWIVKDETLGTYYPVKNKIFHKNYDVA